jgi:hypothetical protein
VKSSKKVEPAKELKPKLKAKEKKLLKKYPDPSAPKRPLCGYFLFIADYRKRQNLQISPSTIGNAARQMSAVWNKLTDAEKQRYNQTGKNGQIEYKQKKEQYDQSGRQQQWLDKITNLTKEKPAGTGYALFVKEVVPRIKKSNPTESPTQILSMAAKEWKSLSEQRKLEYGNKAKLAMSEWKRKLV